MKKKDRKWETWSWQLNETGRTCQKGFSFFPGKVQGLWTSLILFFLYTISVFPPVWLWPGAQIKPVVKLPFVPSPSMNWMYVQYICKLVQNDWKKNENKKWETEGQSLVVFCFAVFLLQTVETGYNQGVWTRWNI